jgi:predicted NUDIX family NTP pyrophosphohydrolase
VGKRRRSCLHGLPDDQNVGAAQKARKEVPEAVGLAIGRRTSYGSADNLRHLQSVGGYCMTGGRMRAEVDVAEERLRS